MKRFAVHRSFTKASSARTGLKNKSKLFHRPTVICLHFRLTLYEPRFNVHTRLAHSRCGVGMTLLFYPWTTTRHQVISHQELHTRRGSHRSQSPVQILMSLGATRQATQSQESSYLCTADSEDTFTQVSSHFRSSTEDILVLQTHATPCRTLAWCASNMTHR